MFSVIFEVHPKTEQWDVYLDNAKMLRPELEQVDGFVDNIRYRSLTREGWILSLSGWRDEKSVVRWRTRMRHHEVQEKGRSEILLDYHLRVGQLTQDTRLPEGYALHEQRLDETEVGAGTTVTLTDVAGWREAPSRSCGARLRHVRSARSATILPRHHALHYGASMTTQHQPNRLAAGPPPIALIDKKAKIN